MHLRDDLPLQRLAHSFRRCLVLQPRVLGNFEQNFAVLIPFAQARHLAVIALQHAFGLFGLLEAPEQPTVLGLRAQYFLTDTPLEHARHLAVIARQQILGLVGLVGRLQPIVFGFFLQ